MIQLTEIRFVTVITIIGHWIAASNDFSASRRWKVLVGINGDSSDTIVGSWTDTTPDYD